MQKKGSLEKAFDQLSGKITAQQQIVAGPKAIMHSWDEPAQALRAGARFLEPLLSQRYDKWNLRRKDFDLLVKLSERYRSLMGFIETYTLDPITTTIAARSENQDAVTLITVHSAKGTESPVCYVIRVEPAMYPYIRSLGNQDEEEEERRILYVAMTRTKNELILTRSASRNSYTYPPKSATEAYFLSTVPDKLVEKHWQYELDFDEDEAFGSC
jgi:DNA helicase-2/ATP-dependent DNA helicase PcrA